MIIIAASLPITQAGRGFGCKYRVTSSSNAYYVPELFVRIPSPMPPFVMEMLKNPTCFLGEKRTDISPLNTDTYLSNFRKKFRLNAETGQCVTS